MYSNSLKTLNTLLQAAIVASGCKLDVFQLDKEDGFGFYVAEKADSDFRVAIVANERLHTVKTIAGDKEVPGTFYDIYAPKYDSGDADVGMDSYYYTDTGEECDWSFMSAADTATKVLSWISEYNIRVAVDNTAEYIYTRELDEIDEEDIT